jgi:hypothetical protein
LRPVLCLLRARVYLFHYYRPASDSAPCAICLSVFFGGGEAAPAAMDWSFGRTPGAAPALMSFRAAAREENTVPQFSPFDAAKTPASRVLTRQVRCACPCSPFMPVHVRLRLFVNIPFSLSGLPWCFFFPEIVRDRQPRQPTIPRRAPATAAAACFEWG